MQTVDVTNCAENNDKLTEIFKEKVNSFPCLVLTGTLMHVDWPGQWGCTRLAVREETTGSGTLQADFRSRYQAQQRIWDSADLLGRHQRKDLSNEPSF
jgi:hypothetical protein